MTSAVPEVGTQRRQRRRIQHQDLSRSQLLDAAEEVFGNKGFHDATLKAVAELAGFSVGSVYSFFENKDDLFRQVYLRRSDDYMPALRKVIAQKGSSLEVLHAVVAFQVEYFRDHPHFGRLYLFHSGHAFSSDASPAFDPAIVQNFEEAMSLQSRLFARGQKAKQLRRGDPAVLSRLLSGMVSAYQQMDPAVTGEDPGVGERLPLADLHEIVEQAFSSSSSSSSGQVAR